MMLDSAAVAARIRAMVRFLGPGEMTPDATRIWNSLADDYDRSGEDDGSRKRNADDGSGDGT